MFNYVRMSDGGPARHEGPRSEIDVIASIAHAVLGQREGQPLQWHELKDHSHIRKLISRIIPGYENLATIDRTKQEFTIPGRVLHEPKFSTDTGRAKMHVIELPPLLGDQVRAVAANTKPGDSGPRDRSPGALNHALRLMTMRSEGQFNTVVYEEEDIYRGQERRDVILMNRLDIERMGFKVDHRVTVKSESGEMPNVIVREFDIPAGNCAMYYPEANVLIPRIADPSSKTPAFKSAVVTIEAAESESMTKTNGQSRLSGEYVSKGSSKDRMNRC
jgi:anaerobic selenocysteine-containing dehydrogenase